MGKLLSSPDKLRKALEMHLDSDKMAIAPKISAKPLRSSGKMNLSMPVAFEIATKASHSEKKARNFIRSLSSVFPKNTGGTRTRRMKLDRKAIEGGLFKLRLHLTRIFLKKLKNAGHRLCVCAGAYACVVF
jgi:hypothetical protein